MKQASQTSSYSLSSSSSSSPINKYMKRSIYLSIYLSSGMKPKPLLIMVSSSIVGPMITTIYIFLFFLRLLGPATATATATPTPMVLLPKSDENLLEFPLNLEYLEAEYFLFGSMGYGLDHIQPNLTGGGPPPIGARKANLTPLIRDIITQFGYQEVGHIRAIKSTIPGFARPLLNLSAQSFATVINNAFGKPLYPLFDPYANDINYLLSSYIIPYVGLTGYVGANPNLQTPIAKKLVAGLLGVESGQDAILRCLLYERATQTVTPYGITVSDFTNKISELRNKLGRAGLKDEGLIVPAYLGAEGKIEGNILSADTNSLAYGRTPEQILRIVYGSGKEQVPGGFYPHGANGTIARKYLQK